MKILQISILVLHFIITNYSFSQINPEWVRTYNGTMSSYDIGSSAVVDDSGYIYVGGTTSSWRTDEDFIILKYNSSGNLIWETKFNDDNHTSEYLSSMCIDNLSNIYVTGIVEDSNRVDCLTAKFNSAGVLVWSQRYNSPYNMDDIAYNIALDKKYNVYISGNSIGQGTDDDILIIKYNSMGTEEWVRRYDGPVHGFEHCGSIAVDSLSNVYLTGTSEAQFLWNAITLKYNSDGQMQWLQRYNYNYEGEEAYLIKLSSDGYLYVGGLRGNGSMGIDYLTIKYDLNGVEQWVSSYNGQAGSYDHAQSLTADSFGNVYITGAAIQFSTNCYTTVKYNSLGIQQWVSIYCGSGYAYFPSSVVLDGYGNVYITGDGTNLGFNRDIVTIKYNNNGIEQWVHRYNNPSNNEDVGNYITVEQNNDVYVIGSSESKENNPDIIVIKYSHLISVISQSNIIPTSFILEQNYPNPFNPVTKIKFSIPKTSYVKLKIFDVLGKLIEELVSEELQSSQYEATFDGSLYSSGVYYYQLISDGNLIDTKKMVLLK